VGPFLGLVFIAVMQNYLPIQAARPETNAADRLADTPGLQRFTAQTASRSLAENLLAPADSVAPLYRRYCQRCHGQDGTGSRARDNLPDIPDFTHHPWHERHTTWRLEVSIREGKGTDMPAFGDRLSQVQTAGLASLVRAFDTMRTKPPKDPPSDFDKEFRKLEEQWQRLRREFRELAPPSGKPQR
jgi:mono/diheme cytochrome c family protein